MMSTRRTFWGILVAALCTPLLGQAQVDFDDDVYYVPSRHQKTTQATSDSYSDRESYYDEGYYEYDEEDAIDAYNRRGDTYQGERGRSHNQGKLRKKGLGKYSQRIMRFHEPATIYLSGDVEIYYEGNGYYGVYNYPDRYDYVVDRYNPIGISINLGAPSWYSSWDYYYDYMWYSSFYPWYVNRYPYPYGWGGYAYWGPSIWYTHPWSWGAGYWGYGYGGYGYAYSHGYHNGYWDGYYAGIYDPYYGTYTSPSRYYSNGRLGNSYFDRNATSNPRANRSSDTNARRGRGNEVFGSVNNRGDFWKNDRNRTEYNEQGFGRSARGSYKDKSSSSSREIIRHSSMDDARRSARGSYNGSANGANEMKEVTRINRGGYFNSDPVRQSMNQNSTNSRSSWGNRSARGTYNSRSNNSGISRQTTSSPVHRSSTVDYPRSSSSARGSYGNSSSGSTSSRSSSSSSSARSSSGSARGRR